MVWKHYADEAYAPENEAHEFEPDYADVHIDDYQDCHPAHMNQEDWEAWYSRDLLNMWMSLMSYGETSGVSSYILTSAQYSDFCDFCYMFSRGIPNRLPS